MKYKGMRGLLIRHAERHGIEAGTLKIIKRKIDPQPNENWMQDMVVEKFPDGVMFDARGRQLFWLRNPAWQAKKIEIEPRYPPKMIIWCGYQIKGRTASTKGVTKNGMAHVNADTTGIYLQVINVMVEKTKGEWYWLYQVKRVDKPKSINKLTNGSE